MTHEFKKQTNKQKTRQNTSIIEQETLKQRRVQWFVGISILGFHPIMLTILQSLTQGTIVWWLQGGIIIIHDVHPMFSSRTECDVLLEIKRIRNHVHQRNKGNTVY